jgi:beta-lactamase class A
MRRLKFEMRSSPARSLTSFLLAAIVTSSFSGSTLRAQDAQLRQISEVAQEAKGKVSLAWALLPTSDFHGEVNSHAHPPMQSVFKLPLAIAVLHLVEQGKFSMDQPIPFLKADRFPEPVHSPLQDEFPNADVDIPLSKLLELAISDSDNVATDKLLQLAGGAEPVRKYIASLGVEGFHLEDGERALHQEPSLQYRNWFEPQGAVQLLARLGSDSPLTKSHTELLFRWMLNSSTQNRISGDLPKGTPVAHKTGSSDTDHNFTPATNDIGLITLPGGRKLALAVFVSDSTADEATRNKVISKIARIIYDEAVKAK